MLDDTKAFFPANFCSLFPFEDEETERTAISEGYTFYCDLEECNGDEDYISSDDEYEEDLDAELDDLEKELIEFEMAKRARRRRAGSVDQQDIVHGSMIPNSSVHSSLSSRGRYIRREALPCHNPRNSKSVCSLPSASKAQQETVQQDDFQNRIRRAVATNSYCQTPSSALVKDGIKEDTTVHQPLHQQRPDECLREILQGISAATFESQTWDGYFTAITPERLAAHCLQVSKAIRKGDVTKLRQLHQQGKRLDSCNRAGESMMHLACRFSNLEVVQCLVQEANVSLRVTDDAGRSPLTDACWNTTPNFELVTFIIQNAPELLFVTDKRGFTPFRYIPHVCWNQWCSYLQTNQAFLCRQVNQWDIKRQRNSWIGHRNGCRCS